MSTPSGSHTGEENGVEHHDYVQALADLHAPPLSRAGGQRVSKRPPGRPPSRKKSSKKSEAFHLEVPDPSRARRDAKDRRQRAIQQARAFKELDMTIEVLGIECGSAPKDVIRQYSSHSPGMSTPVRTESGSSGQLPEVEAGMTLVALNERETRWSTGDIFNPHLSMDRRSRSARSFASLLQQNKETTTNWPMSSMGRHRRQHSADETQAFNRLQEDRYQWRETLQNALHAKLSEEDIEVVVREAFNHAEELRAQIHSFTMQLTLDSWQECEAALVQLETAFKRAKLITKDIRSQHDLLEEAGLADAYGDIVHRVLPEFADLARATSHAITEGLKAWGGQEDCMRHGLGCVKRIVSWCVTVTERQRKNIHRKYIGYEDWCHVEMEMGNSISQVIHTVMDLTREFQSKVLSPTRLSGCNFAHELASSSRVLQHMWKSLLKRVHSVVTCWPGMRLPLAKGLCNVYLEAAQLATEMQDQSSAGASNSDTESEDDAILTCVWTPSGTWCHPVVRGETCRLVDEIQGGAWVPGLLLSLLHHCQSAHKQLRDELAGTGQTRENPNLSLEDRYAEDEELFELLDALQYSFFELTLSTVKRTARLLKHPDALELTLLDQLKEQAEHSLRFVQEYDQGSLGLGDILAVMNQQEGKRLFRTLKRATDQVVNGLLHVKRLLKAKLEQPVPSNSLRVRTTSHSDTGVGTTSPSGLGAIGPPHRLLVTQQSSAPAQLSFVSRTDSGCSWGWPPDRGRSPALSKGTIHRQISSPFARTDADSPVFKDALWAVGESPFDHFQSSLSAGVHGARALGQQSKEYSAGAKEAGRDGRTSAPLPVGKAARNPRKGLSAGTLQIKQSRSDNDLAGMATRVDLRDDGNELLRSGGVEAGNVSVGSPLYPAGEQASDMLSTSPLVVPSLMFGSIGPDGLQPREQGDFVFNAPDAPLPPCVSPKPFGTRAPLSNISFFPRYSFNADRAQVKALADNSPTKSTSPLAPAGTSPHSVTRKPTPIALEPGGRQHVKQVSFEVALDSVSSPKCLSGPPGQSHGVDEVEPPRLSEAPATTSGSLNRSQHAPLHRPPSAPPRLDSPFQNTMSPFAAPPQEDVNHGNQDAKLDTTEEASQPIMPPQHLRRVDTAHTQPGASQHLFEPPARYAFQSSSTPLMGRVGSLEMPRTPTLTGDGIVGRNYSEEGSGPQVLEKTHGKGANGAEEERQASALHGCNCDVTAFDDHGDKCQVGAEAPSLAHATIRTAASTGHLSRVTTPSPHESKVSVRMPVSRGESETTAGSERQGSVENEAPPGESIPLVDSGTAHSVQSACSDDDDFWKIRWKDLEPGLIRKLGSGSYGQVYQGVYLNADVAIKVINIDLEAGFDSEVLEKFRKEVDFQRRLSFHPNVVRFIGACCEYPDEILHEQHVPSNLARGVKLAIVMELCPLGSVFSMLNQARKVRMICQDVEDPRLLRQQFPYGYQFYQDWLTRLEVARGAAAGIEYMHQHGVVHRDLTSYNLLLDYGKPWVAKVCDFNLSRMLHDRTSLVNSGNPNSPGWQAPEMLAGERYGKAADVFSFGVILWELVTLKEPWREEAEGKPYLYYIMNNVIEGKRLEFPSVEAIEPVLPEVGEVIALAQSCWHQLAVQRPTMSEVASRLREIIASIKLRKQRSRSLGGSRTGSGEGSAVGAEKTV